MLFRDRYDAALKLIPHLEKYRNEQGIVLAVPRGGVPVGYLIAKNYNFPMELLLIKKIGHPESEELAIGAVSLEDHILDNRFNAPAAYLENEIKKIRAGLLERYKKFMGEKHRPAEVENKTVIIVDDGIATGNTILAAIKMMRKKKPRKIIVAVPVAPPETLKKLRNHVDDLICLHSPADFFGVGQFYIDFSEISDEEVSGLLKEINHYGAAA